MLAKAFNFNIPESETGGSLVIQGQPGQHSERKKEGRTDRQKERIKERGREEGREGGKKRKRKEGILAALLEILNLVPSNQL